MPRADGPFKVLEKINDNAYKLELPADFGVSPTFNIADLKPYLGEDNELSSRTLHFNKGRMMRTLIPLLHPQPLLLYILDQLLELVHAN